MKFSVKIRANLKAIERLRQTQGGKVRAGWEKESDVLHAIINEFGAHLKGGQPFFIDDKGDIHFLKKTSPLGIKAMRAAASGGPKTPSKPKPGRIQGLGVTKPSEIPPRPFISETVRLHRKEWEQLYKTLIMAVANSTMSEAQAMEALGLRIAADLKMTISEGNFKPNSPLTVKAKGKNTPLIWTGDMQDHVAHEVIMGAAK